MATKATAPVAGATNGVGAAAQATAATTPASEGVAQATNLQAPADASGNRQGAPARNPTQQDLDKLRSALQRDANAQVQRVQAEADQRLQAMQAQLNQVMQQGMTDEQRAAFQQQQQQAYYQQLTQQNQQYQQMLSDQSNRQNYLAYFTQQMGVPLSALNLTGTTEELVASGWQSIQAELTTYRGGGTAAAQTPEGQDGPPMVPEVVTTSAAPGGQRTWPELVTALGMSEEQIYRAVETGQLPIDIIPTPPV